MFAVAARNSAEEEEEPFAAAAVVVVVEVALSEAVWSLETSVVSQSVAVAAVALLEKTMEAAQLVDTARKGR